MGLAARKIDPDAERRLQEASLSLDGKRLLFLFEGGEGYSIPRERLPGDDGTPVTHIQIFDHRGAVCISQASGHLYDLPWDSIKHYAGGGRPRKQAIGSSLKRLRRQRGLTQERLSKAAGISRMHLTRLESNVSTPNLDTLMKLAGALRISPSVFFI